jgi:micrococcal nuclease
MYEYNCTLTYWVDGDTCDVDIDLGFGVVLKDQRVRLMGINTPETRTRDEEEKRAGNLATNYCKSRIPEGKKCRIRTFKDGKGKFGRILGEMLYGLTDEKTKEVTWHNLNKKLLDEGHAVPYE